MADQNMNLGSTPPGSTGTDGLADKPEQSPLEQSLATQPPQTPPASNALPTSPDKPPAPPESTPVGDQTDVSPEPETASVPDTDKFLESILKDEGADGQVPEITKPPEPSAPSSMSPAGPTPPNTAPPSEPAPAVPAPNAGMEIKVNPTGENGGVGKTDESTNLSVQDLDSNRQQEKVDFGNGLTTPQSAIKDDLGALDSIKSTDAIQPQSKPISQKPLDSMQMPPTAKKGGAGKALLLILLLLILAGGGYYAYTTFLAPSKSASTSTESTPAVEATATTLTNDAKRKQDLSAIQQALVNYYAATGSYPQAATLIKLSDSGNILDKDLVAAGYISALPTDPDSAKYYAYKSDGKTFTLSAVLDDSSDSSVKVVDGKAIFEVAPDTVVSDSSGAYNPFTETSATTSEALPTN